jgi:hypothetical protein
MATEELRMSSAELKELDNKLVSAKLTDKETEFLSSVASLAREAISEKDDAEVSGFEASRGWWTMPRPPNVSDGPDMDPNYVKPVPGGIFSSI